MKYVVMKFGGTSVEDAVAIDRTARIVARRREQGVLPIVVVSAMAKVTDQLIAASNAAGRGDRAGALAISARLLRDFGVDRQALRVSRRDFSRTCSGRRADRAHQRSCRQLRRTAIQSH